MRVLYFAWVRERIGLASEEIDTNGAQTAGDLVALLVSRGSEYALAFENLAAIRVAIDQEMGDLESSITGADEVAFFPPVTGG
ncbi:MAG: molybdopterin converting factor subunit 1 [Pseudomonadota bacterium]